MKNLRKIYLFLGIVILVCIISIIYVNKLQNNDEVNAQRVSSNKTTQNLENYLQKNPDDVEAILALGHLYSNSNIEKAQELYLEAASKDPNNLLALLRLGNTYVKMNKYDKALNSYREAAEKDASNAQIHYYISLALLPSDINESVLEAQKAVDLGKISKIDGVDFLEAYLNSINTIKLNKPNNNNDFIALLRSDYIPFAEVKLELIKKLEINADNKLKEELLVIRNQINSN